MNLLESFARAFEIRRPLHNRPDQTVYRLFHGYAEGHPGLTVDRWHDTAVLTCKVDLGEELEPLADLLDTRYGFANVVVRQHRAHNWAPQAKAVRAVRGHLPNQPIEVRDNGLRFWATLHTPEAQGLFLDARPARTWLMAHSSGRRILNLFAYTGSLGIAAAKGDARSVTHLDSKAAPLEKARANHRLNRLRVDERDFLKGNVYQHLPRARRAGVLFDGIILDPPPQVPQGMAHRRPRGQDFAQLAALTAPLLAPGGWLLCFFSRYDHKRAAYEKEVLDHAGVPLGVLWRGESGQDFPEDDPERKLRLTAFAREGT